MANKIKRELYSFSIDLETEEEKEVIKEVKRKNKETGKMETVDETIKKVVKVKTPVRLFLKKPTRTQIEDGDMFYSIWLNKFIKMGLLTRAMLAKKQVDIGGTLNDDDKLHYAQLYLQLFEKQQSIIRYSAKDRDEMSGDEKERLDSTISELAVIRKQLADFEAAQASIFDHTADVKARNKTITWFLLHLAFYSKGEEEGPDDAMPLFPGTDFDQRYRVYQESDEEQSEIFVKSIDRLSTIATIWYMSGLSTQEEFESVLEEMNQETDAPDSVAQKVDEATAKKVKEAKSKVKTKKPEADTAKEAAPTKRGRPKKAPVSEN